MPKSAFLISLDFEMFWGVTDSRTIEQYGSNVRANWQTIPRMLELFRKHKIHVTWATVGMLLCRDYRQWAELRPGLLPDYKRESCSNYAAGHLAKQFPDLFFARPLAERILDTPGQELGSHTYSHFFCGEENVSLRQFAADLECGRQIFAELNTAPASLVFPRNQVRPEYLEVLPDYGIKSYRGNPEHWLYRDGHVVASASHKAYRVLRMADSCLPLTGHHAFTKPIPAEVANLPASRFLRPITGKSIIDKLHTGLVKSDMLAAAKASSHYHLWWHPHNFGKHSEANLARLDNLLTYFNKLKDDYGMESLTMQELEKTGRQANNG